MSSMRFSESELVDAGVPVMADALHPIVLRRYVCMCVCSVCVYVCVYVGLATSCLA